MTKLMCLDRLPGIEFSSPITSLSAMASPTRLSHPPPPSLFGFNSYISYVNTFFREEESSKIHTEKISEKRV
ncbi:hypothetical protein TIFTF001_022483 [Ficus carica]|uniref:Uncharacterized protein n=1 Tax=Ficus carica TaxID=3494 RepID=A0AA88DFK0_FICCA|nr:hypothetical protein TIFTF001_022483 [Ficus carica]